MRYAPGSEMGETVSRFTISVESVERYEYRVRFDDAAQPPLTTDEPPPLGRNRGPNPSRLLAAAVGNCLAASLTFCLQRHKASASVSAEVSVEMVRNERKRLRVGKISVVLRPSADVDREALAACASQFEDFCVVTESVRQGLEVAVQVAPPPG
jgi:uncharacterized OsmC-like protein